MRFIDDMGGQGYDFHGGLRLEERRSHIAVRELPSKWVQERHDPSNYVSDVVSGYETDYVFSGLFVRPEIKIERKEDT